MPIQNRITINGFTHEQKKMLDFLKNEPGNVGYIARNILRLGSCTDKQSKLLVVMCDNKRIKTNANSN